MSQPVLERPGRRRRSVATLAVAALVASGAGVVAAAPAGAIPVPSAGALAQMFSGTLQTAGGPVDVSSLLGLAPVGAVSPGGEGPNLGPISRNVLMALQGDLSGGSALLGQGGIVDMQAVNQVAGALPDGSSFAAVGSVTDAGGLAGVANPTSIDLESLLGQVPALQSGLSTLKLTLGSIAAKATQTAGGVQSGQYDITGGQLSFANLDLANLVDTVTQALAPVQQAVNGLAGSNALGGSPGGLLTAFNSVPLVGSLLSSIGAGNLTQAASVTSNLQSAVAPLLANPFTSPDGSVSLDPVTGLFTADLAQLAGGNLGSLPANTDLLSAGLLSSLVTQVVGLVNNLVTAIENAVTSAIGSAPVSLTSVGSNGLLGLLGSSMNVSLTGTLGQVLNGTAPITQTLTLLGLPVSLDALSTLTALAAPVLNLLNVSAVPDFSSLLGSGLQTPATGPLTDALNAVTQLLGIDINKQSTGLDGVFTQIAMVLKLLPGDPLAILNLGSASVGPNAPNLVAPSVSALSPVRGPAAGGQIVTVTGSNFLAGLTTVTVGGTTIPAGQVNVVSTTQLTFTTPAHAAGAVSVTVGNAVGSSAAKTYTYLPKPAIRALYPASGPSTGGKVISITGTGFVPGATTVKFGSSTVAAGSVTVTGTTRLTLKTPKRAAGSVSVTVTTPGGTSSAKTYVYRAAPAVTSLSKTRGATAGGRSLTIKGARFVGGQTAVWFGTTLVRAAAVKVTSSTSLVVTTPAHAAGSVAVKVMTPGGTSNAKSYRYVAGTRLAVKETKLSVTRGSTSGGSRVVVSGAGFVPGTSSVRIGTTVIPAALVTVVSPGTLWFLTPARSAGTVSVRVVNGKAVSTARAFRYVTPSAALSAKPAISSPRSGASTVAPAPFVTGTGTPGATVTVTVDGVGYCTAGVNAGKAWTCAGTSPLLRGKHYVTASQKASGRAQSRQASRVTLTVG